MLARFVLTFARFIFTLARFIFTLARFIFTLARFVFTLARFVFTLACFVLTLARFIFTLACFVFTLACFVFTLACFIFTLACFVFTLACLVLTLGCFFLMRAWSVVDPRRCDARRLGRSHSRWNRRHSVPRRESFSPAVSCGGEEPALSERSESKGADMRMRGRFTRASVAIQRNVPRRSGDAAGRDWTFSSSRLRVFA